MCTAGVPKNWCAGALSAHLRLEFMTTPVNLPAPAHWRDRSALFLLGVAGLLGMAVFFVVRAQRTAAQGHWVATVIAGAAATGLLAMGGVVVVTRLGVLHARVRVDSVGTVLIPRSVRGVLLFAMAMLVVACGVFLLDHAAVQADFPAISDREFGRVIAVFVVSVLGLVGLLRGLGSELGRLTLSPRGIEYIDYRGRSISVSWNDIDVIDDRAPRGRSFRAIALHPTSGTPVVIYNASLYCEHGAALFWMLQHYWRTPAQRGELTNGVALQRLRAQHFEAR